MVKAAAVESKKSVVKVKEGVKVKPIKPAKAVPINHVDDIESMFNELAAKKQKNKKKLELIEKEQLRIEKARIKEEKLAKSGVVLNNGPIINPDPPVHRIDAATGLPVYKAKLLKANEGGGTSLCPFDCNCCF